MWTKEFWLAVSERAVRTFAQSLAALLAVNGLGLLDVEWLAVLSAAGLTTLLSILTSISSGLVQHGEVTIGRHESPQPAPQQRSEPSAVAVE